MCGMLTPTGRTNGSYARISVTTSRIKIDICMEEADRSNASAVVHKSRSEAEGTFFRQFIGSTVMEKR